MRNSELVRKYAILIIALAALGVYYPVLYAHFSSLDDLTIINGIADPDNPITLNNIVNFFKPNSIDRYFRPLLMLSFIIDSKIWSYQASGYHLTNYILHFLNCLLLYFSASKLFSILNIGSCFSKPIAPSTTLTGSFRTDSTAFSKPHNSRHLALICAVLFSIHPLTCESVAWISGRTDVLACFFSLLAFYFFLSDFKGSSFLCAAFFLAGLLSKESALAIFPITFIVHISLMIQDKISIRKIIPSCITSFILFAIPLLIYFYLRMDGLTSLDQGLKTALSDKVATGAQGFSFATMQYLAAVIAFYIKKLFIPIPLNFAISEINIGFYSLFFIFLTICFILLLVKKEFIFATWLIVLILSFSPSLLVATSKIAWTPLAERYLYLSVAVWVFFPVLLYYRISTIQKKYLKLAIPILSVLILTFFGITFSRALLWNDNEKLWADTYLKNPNSGKVLFKYGEILGPEKGSKYFKQAVEKVPDDQWKELSLLALAKDDINDKKYEQAMDYVHHAISIKQSPDTCYEAAKILRAIANKNHSMRENNLRTSISYYKMALSKQKEPFALYQIARLYSQLNDPSNELDYLTKIITDFPKTSYAGLAKIRLNNIISNKSRTMEIMNQQQGRIDDY